MMIEPLNLNHARAVCAEIGLPFDEEGAADALAGAELVGLTQGQFDAAMDLHARRVKHLFTPTAYGWRERVAIAFHFLFNPRRWRV
jgi:hypothetical protein